MKLPSYKRLLTLLTKKFVIISFITLSSISTYLYWGYDTYYERARELLKENEEIYDELENYTHSLFYLYRMHDGILSEDEAKEIYQKIAENKEFIALRRKVRNARSNLRDTLNGDNLKGLLLFKPFLDNCTLIDLTFDYKIYTMSSLSSEEIINKYSYKDKKNQVSRYRVAGCYYDLANLLGYNEYLVDYIPFTLTEDIISRGYYLRANYIKALAYYYYKGENVRQDKKKAKEYFGLACDQKDTEACQKYAELNEQGI